ncbi:MAG: hypothetical protein ACI4PD_05030, partial [Butyricicoccus sp.]
EKFTEAYESGADSVPGKDADYQRMIDPNQAPEISWAWKKIYLEGYLKIDFDNVCYSDYNGAPTATATKTQAILDKEMMSTYVGIIMGSQPVSSFDDFVENYKELGGAKISEEIKAEVG